MAGELLNHGFQAVGIPYAKKLEFNVALDELFSLDGGSHLLESLATCVMPDQPRGSAMRPKARDG